ncbi:MAG: lipopolysaccharide biosynthesis protein [Beijerinckiaceae bacterium]|nr:lipopolysaccharide biosynthesis protein [Beijerinckiaceae bacterium]
MRVLGAFFINVVFNLVIGLLVAKFLGPEEYGRFALALATAVAVQFAFVDWLRLGATRFYSERTRDEEPAVRATLDLGFAAVLVGLAVGSTCLFMTGIRFSLSNGLIALALGAAVANGLFDFSTALVRARFHDGLYTKLVIVKNVLSLGLTGGGAFYFGSAKMALAGGIVSLAGSVVAVRAALRDPFTLARMASLDIAKSILRYAMPIVAANLLYLCIPLANRSLLSIYYGFSETGQFSLAFDIGSKALAAIGTALDVLLFQIAVAAHDEYGLEQSKQRIADNMGIVIAVMVPACIGIWLVLPSIQQVIVPEEFRGPFGDLLDLMLPGLFCSAMILFGLNPMFQIAKRTWPLIGAAVAGCIADPLILLALPRDLGANSLAIAQSGAFAVALATLTGVACLWNPRWPRWRDLAATALGTAAMTAALLPLRAQPAGLATLLEQVAAGTIVYSAAVFALDIAKLRTILLGRLLPIVTRFMPG